MNVYSVCYANSELIGVVVSEKDMEGVINDLELELQKAHLSTRHFVDPLCVRIQVTYGSGPTHWIDWMRVDFYGELSIDTLLRLRPGG
jgi:hypothetical protein